MIGNLPGMKVVQDLVEWLEGIAPKAQAWDQDRLGLLVGSPHAQCKRLLLALDVTRGAIEQAVERGADTLLTHHPLIWNPLTRLTDSSHAERCVAALIRHGINHVASHTDWDAAAGGVSDTLGERLGLQGLKPVGKRPTLKQWKLVTFVPLDHLKSVRGALANAGAGVIGAYTECSFSTEGMGTFRGNENSNPAIGRRGELESVQEARLEMVVPEQTRASVERALLEAHPYEEVAHDWIAIQATAGLGFGRVGELPSVLSVSDFAAFVDERLQTRSWTWTPDARKAVKRIAVSGGSGSKGWDRLLREGADVLVTGEVSHDVALEAVEAGLTIIAAGHYATEHPAMESLAHRVTEAGWSADLYSPQTGLGGRPL